jgi:hypothetical protein
MLLRCGISIGLRDGSGHEGRWRPSLSGKLSPQYCESGSWASRPCPRREVPLSSICNAAKFLFDALVQIPTHSGQGFQREAGRDSDLKPATIPI